MDRRGGARAVVAACAAALGLGACDPPPPRDILLGPSAAEPFAVASVSVKDSALAVGRDLEIRFNRPLDAAAAGPRSVLVSGPRRRRLAAACVRIEGDVVRVPADAVAAVAEGGVAELRIEGGSSPCALRAAGGEVLGERFRLLFRVGDASRSDLDGPVLVASRPAPGDAAAAPGTSVELRFSEPVVARDDSVSLTVDGVPRAAVVRPSSDRRRVVVRPEVPFAPGSAVALELHRSLTDDAGNPLGSAARLAFRVRTSPVHEIEEEFASDEFLDRAATDCAWGELGAVGLLVPRCGPTPLASHESEPSADLGDRASVRFQFLVHGADVPGGVASGLRLRFARAGVASPVTGIWAEGGATAAEALTPSFGANRDDVALSVLAQRGGEFEWEPDDAGGAVADIPFEQPLFLVPGQPVLLDVTVDLAPGARLAATPDDDFHALVRDAGRDRLAPAAALLVSGLAPTARSLWYDSGAESPRWRPAVVDRADGGEDASMTVEFQAAPADAEGRPDAGLASPWERDLSRLPSWRFVRFRIRFGAGPRDGAGAVERVAMPFEASR